MTYLKREELIRFIKQGKNKTRTREELFELMNKHYIGKERIKKQALRMFLIRLEKNGIIKIVEGNASFWGKGMKCIYILHLF